MGNRCWIKSSNVDDAYASRMMMDTAHEVAAQISGSGKEGVRIYPESLEPKKEEAAPAAVAAPQ